MDPKKDSVQQHSYGWKNEITKKQKTGGKNNKNVTKSKESNELQEGYPTNNFLVGNYRPRRAERWENMPSMSSEVGEI